MSTETTPSNITTAQGPAAKTAPDSMIGEVTGKESALSNYVGPYVTEMLGRGQAVARDRHIQVRLQPDKLRLKLLHFKELLI